MIRSNLKKVYLDTNVLIQGEKKSGHDFLKKLSREDRIILLVSIHTDLEQHGKVSRVLQKKYKAVGDLTRASLQGDYEEKFVMFKAVRKEYEDARENEQIEKNYWSDSKLFRLTSHFNALIVSIGVIPDYKGELKLLEELLEKYVLNDKDALHIMNAYSSGSDYFLTWDKQLINKSKKVSWLGSRMEVMTPKVFLERFTETVVTII